MNRNKWKAQTASIPPTLFFSFWTNIRCPFLDLCRNVNRGNELPSLVFKRSTYGWHISTGFANPSYSFSRLTDLNLTLTHFVLGLVLQHCRWVLFFLFHVFTLTWYYLECQHNNFCLFICSTISLLFWDKFLRAGQKYQECKLLRVLRFRWCDLDSLGLQLISHMLSFLLLMH